MGGRGVTYSVISPFATENLKMEKASFKLIRKDIEFRSIEEIKSLVRAHLDFTKPISSREMFDTGDIIFEGTPLEQKN